MDIEALKEALCNENNSSIIKTSISEIKSNKNTILQRLGLNREDLKNLNKKLKGYRYIEDINDLMCGNTIKTIKLVENDNIKLNSNVIICDIKLLKKGSAISVRTFFNKHYTLYFEEHLIFQKITNEEALILKAVNYLEK